MERTKHKAAFVSSKHQHSVFLDPKVHWFECVQLVTRRRGVPNQGRACGGLPARCLWFHETGPFVPLATGMETRPESEQACQLGVVQTSAGNQGPPRCWGLLTPGFTLRKAILSCDHWSVTSTKHALGLSGFLQVIMDEEGGPEPYPPAQALEESNSTEPTGHFFFPQASVRGNSSPNALWLCAPVKSCCLAGS